MSSQPSPPLRRDARMAFSLIEVTLALAVISVTLLSLVGMLGQALNVTHEAAGRTLSSDIAGRLTGELQQQDWAEITGAPPEVRYFDRFGEELPPGSGAAEATFTAQAVVGFDGIALGDPSLGLNPHGRTVSVLVADRFGPSGKRLIDDYLENGRTSDDLNLFQSLVVNLEKR